jgi:signal transduction histidine kinase/CheY-like chemotaxis protein
VEVLLEERETEIEDLLQSQSNLEESLGQYVGLYEEAPIGFATLTPRGTIARINLTGAAMLGYDRLALQHTLLRKYLADRGDIIRLQDHLRRCRNDPGRVETQVALKTASGQRLEVSLISHSSGEPGNFFHTAIIDLTEKNRVTRELTAHARRIELLSSVAAQLLIGDSPRMLLGNIFHQIAAELRVEYYFNYLVSPASAKLVLENYLGLTEEQKQDFQELCMGQALCGAAAQKRETLVLHNLQQQPHPGAESLLKMGVRAYACYPLIARDRLLGTLSFATTSRDQFTEEELQFMRTVRGLVTASMDRARLLTEISAARDAAEHASRAKDDFMATLSHELRTPLNPVLLMASEGADNPALPWETREQFAAIRKNVELEARLIDDLLDMTRVTRGKVSLQLAPCRVDSVLRDALSTVQSDIAQKNIVLRTKFNARESTIVGDSVRLQQVFWNVLKNAIKFTPVNGQIRVATKLTPATAMAPPRLAVTITDTGIGMSREELERIFRPFSQGDHAATADFHGYGGLGLGLAISKTLVELHSGIIYARSRGYGRGAAFTIELPLAQEEDLFRPSELPTLPSKPVLAAKAPAGGRILLVEDHEPTRAVLGRLLARRHYDVTIAGSVAEAVAAAGSCKKPFDLLISDIGLPDGTGYDVIAAVRKLRDLPGIALTGYGTEEDVLRSRQAGFNTHLTKPVSVQALERAMAEVLSPTHGPDTNH